MNEALLSLIGKGIAANPSAVIVLDARFRVVFANDSALRVWGYATHEDVKGKRALAFWQNESLAREFARAIGDAGAWTGELVATLADGRATSLHGSANSILDDDGQLAGVLGIFSDVTVQRNEFRQLDEWRQLFTYISERAKFVAWETIPERDYFRSLGDVPIIPLTLEDASRFSLSARLALYHPEHRQRLWELLQPASAEAGPLGPIKTMIPLADGSELWLEHGAYLASPPGERPIRLAGWSRDITDHRKAEEALRSAEERYRLATEFSRSAVWEAYPELDMVYTQGQPLVDLDRTSAHISEVLNLYFPEDRPAVEQQIADLVGGRRDNLEFEVRTRGRDGSTRWLSLRGNRADEPGGPMRVIGTSRDITEQRLADERLRHITEDAPVGIVTASLDGAISSCNPACERMFGYASGVLAGQSVFTLAPPHLRESLRDTIDAYLRSGRTRDMERGLRGTTGLRRDGSEFPLEMVASEVRSATGAPEMLIIFVDVADLRAAQDQLRQAQKMEALGQLTGGIAHDFNNLLMVLQMSLELLHSSQHLMADDRRYVETALHAIQRGAGLTQRLLAFSRKQTLNPEIVDPRRIVREMTDLLQRSLGSAITLTTTVEGESWNILIDPGQLENAILNLAINARDAMPEGGRLTIAARNSLVAEVADDDMDAANGYVVLSVTDTGTGMPPEVANRALEPFFTTKAAGKGTGLGLSMVYGLVKQSQGHMQIRSEPGAGTQFRLFFPRATEPARHDVQTLAPPPVVGGGTLLVVEDDPTIRNTLVKVLQRMGYEAYSAGDGPDALRLIEEFGVTPELVLCDVNLPNGMKGTEVAAAIMERVTGCRAVLMSGSPDGYGLVQDMVQAGRASLLAKPYTQLALAATIHQALAS